MEKKKAMEPKESTPVESKWPTPIKRPDILWGITIRVDTQCGHLYVTVNFFDHSLFEVFARLGHSGGCSASHLEGLTRAISVGLRCGVNPRDYIKTLVGTRCPSPTIYPEEKQTFSCSDAVGRMLLKAQRLLDQGEAQASIQKIFEESVLALEPREEKVEGKENQGNGPTGCDCPD